jgi:hypothetical protein
MPDPTLDALTLEAVTPVLLHLLFGEAHFWALTYVRVGTESVKRRRKKGSCLTERCACQGTPSDSLG